jgi:uncharacterized protein (DUF433 family)
MATAPTIGKGIYGFREAAAFTGLKLSRVREWFRQDENRKRPFLAGDYERVGDNRAISFLDLIDVFVAGQLRDHGVTLQTLRKVYTRMSVDLGTPHPFSRAELLSNGKSVFTRNIDDAGKEELIEVLTRQRVFPEILKPFLQKVDYDQVTSLAVRWRIADGVIIDPEISFGRPCLQIKPIATAVLYAAYRANRDDRDAVARFFKISPTAVDAAVKFELNLATAA